MKSFFKDHCLKIAILIIIFSFGFCCFAVSYQKSQPPDNLKNDIDLQIMCSDRAAIYFKRYGYEDDSQDYSTEYINHWNKKLGKCLIQIISRSRKEDFVTIDIYDAIEGKRFALFIGHDICDPIITGDSQKCQFDSGKIWLDGDDTRNPADYNFGFQGILVGPGVGDEKTQKEFLEHIKPLMTE